MDADVALFHAATALSDNGVTMTSGGRVLAVVATGDNMADARARVYENAARVSFPGMMYRTDIALREVS